MFRFLYSRVLCGPCTFVRKRRAKERKEKIEEETGVRSDQPRPSVWKLDNEDQRKNPGKRLSNSMDNDDDIDDEDLARNQRVGVPLTVTMVIITTYILIGAAIFHSFEGWSMIQAAYFCFITLGKTISALIGR